MKLIGEMLSYPFLVRAMVGGILISLCAALLGVSLVLKRYSMIGDGLSHVSFGTLSIALVLGFSPLLFSIPIVILAAFLLLKMNERAKFKSDTAIAILSTTSLAIGVVATSLSSGMNVDVANYMFGSILALSDLDVWISIVLTIMVVGLYVVFYHHIFAITFDETFAKATGLPVSFYTMLLSFLTAITIVIGMRIMGTLLISSLIIFPAVISMYLFKTFRSVMISSVILSIIAFLIGLFLSYFYGIPVGASIVLVNAVLLVFFRILSCFFKRVKI